ncbi:MAG TPA: CHAP domain-containing protein [Solirubrobacteraceae bacterium]|jgi:hypothetical protein|nr:CHAP domain-containing protein [Solirubrobacteraceae bacterium]
MSVESTLAQVSAIRQALANPATLIGSSADLSGGTEAPAAESTTGTSEESSFAAALAQASGGYQSAAAPTAVLAEPDTYNPTGLAGTTGLGYSSQLQSADGIVGSSLGTPGESAGARIVAIAESQLGQTEQPPGSNESPAIAQYRTATEGAIPGAPWCAYFASWVARQAGEPLGAQGQGIGDVSDIWSWAQSTGRAIPNGPGVVPKPGDLIVFGGEHVGIVRGILPSGQIATIEGNYENKVAANVRSPTEATGYVSMS